VSIGGLHSFQNLHFYVPATLTHGGSMLTVANAVFIDLPAPTVSVAVAAGSTLAVGDRIVLMDIDVLWGSAIPTSVTSLTTGYRFTVVEGELENWKWKLVVQVTSTPNDGGGGGSGGGDDTDGSNAETTGNNTEAGQPDKPTGESSGCGCSASGNRSFSGLGFVLSLALFARLRRRTVVAR